LTAHIMPRVAVKKCTVEYRTQERVKKKKSEKELKKVERPKCMLDYC